MKHDLKKGQAEEEDIRHFSRVHGLALLTMGPIADEPVIMISAPSNGSSSRSSMSSVPSESLLKTGYMAPNERVAEWLEHVVPAVRSNTDWPGVRRSYASVAAVTALLSYQGFKGFT